MKEGIGDWYETGETPKDLEGWKGVSFESSSSLTPQFSAFAKAFKKFILKSLPWYSTLVGWNRGHFYVSGFIRRGTKVVYFSISDVRFFPEDWHKRILIRTAKDEKDFTGGTNNFTTLESFQEVAGRLLTWGR